MCGRQQEVCERGRGVQEVHDHGREGRQWKLEPGSDLLWIYIRTNQCLYQARIEAEVEARSKTGKITLAFIRR